MAGVATGRNTVVEVTPILSSTRVDSASPGVPSLAGSRWRRSNFWGALAGMAMAIAIACAVVAMEMAGQSDESALHFRRRADRLQARLGRIEERLTVANREVAEMRRQASVREEFNRIVAAPDGQVVHLEATNRRAPWHGALAFSATLSKAVLEVDGGSDSRPPRLALEWIRRQGAILQGGEFAAHDPGQPDVVVELAPPPPEVVAVVVAPAGVAKPGGEAPGPQLLRGEIPHASKPARAVRVLPKGNR